MLRPELMSVARALLTVEAEALSLDHVAEALGSLRVTPDEIEALIDWLEGHGRPMLEPVRPPAATTLNDVLVAARSLREELGRTPQPREIAARAALSLEAVKRALWFARILQR
jgi:hypothetical protein